MFEHVEYFRWEATDGEARRRNVLYMERDSGSLGNSLVAFVNVEEEDPKNVAAVGRAIRTIDKLATELRVENVVLYPFAHLVPEGHASHEAAVRVIASLGEGMSGVSNGYNVVSVPFGCSKVRESKVFGHEKAVLLRTIR